MKKNQTKRWIIFMVILLFSPLLAMFFSSQPVQGEISYEILKVGTKAGEIPFSGPRIGSVFKNEPLFDTHQDSFFHPTVIDRVNFFRNNLGTKLMPRPQLLSGSGDNIQQRAIDHVNSLTPPKEGYEPSDVIVYPMHRNSTYPISISDCERLSQQTYGKKPLRSDVENNRQPYYRCHPTYFNPDSPSNDYLKFIPENHWKYYATNWGMPNGTYRDFEYYYYNVIRFHDDYFIQVKWRPITKADFSYETPVYVGDTVQFTDLTTNAGSPINYWRWRVAPKGTPSAGRVVFSNDQHPSYTFTEPGCFDISMDARAENGSADYMIKTVHVMTPTTADFEWEDPVYEGDTVSFTDLSYNDGSPIVQWQWQVSPEGAPSSDRVTF